MPKRYADVAVEALIPSLIQCFGVIVLGYLAGRWQMLSKTQATGLNFYVTKFALPAVFFKVMVSVDFDSVCWYLVLAVSLSKTLAFVFTFLLTLLLSARCEFGAAGILSMFVSQSNDVALGYPILRALYPELANYVYLFAPAQIAVLNPVSYFFLEWHLSKVDSKAISEPHSSEKHFGSLKVRHRGCRRVLQVLLRVTLNPLFFMTVIGVVVNFILQRHIPVCLDGFLQILADSFSATALFSLGFGMVGKMSSITRNELFILTAILLGKLILLPFITRELVAQMVSGADLNTTQRFSSFGFLYGAIPTAPSVYLFALQYGVLSTVIGVGLVLGTFLCGPMMFILARIVTVYTAEPSQYDQLLETTIWGTCWISVVCSVWTILVLLFTRKAFRVPHRFTVSYLGCVILLCTTVIVDRFVSPHYLDQSSTSADHQSVHPSDWSYVLRFAFFFIGCTGARFWVSLIAVSLLLERKFGICFILRHQGWFYFLGFTSPTLATAILLISSTRQQLRDVHPAFQYGNGQLIVSLVVLLVNVLVTLTVLILYIRLRSPPSPLSSSSMIERTDIQPSDFSQMESAAVNSPVPYSDHHSSCPSSSTTAPSRCWSAPLVLGLDACTITQRDVVSITTDELEQCSSDGLANDSQMLLSSTLCKCTLPNQRRRCIHILTRYKMLCSSKFEPSWRASVDVTHCSTVHMHGHSDEFQHQRHLLLLILLLTTMFFGICLCIWRLVQEAPSGVYLVLEFLDGTFCFGQGVILFIVFGLDIELITVLLKQVIERCKCKWYRSEASAVEQPNLDQEATAGIVNQFVVCHLNRCSQAIGRRVDDAEYGHVFTEASLKQWLLSAKLVKSECEATQYVHALEIGCAIREVTIADLPSVSWASSSGRVLTFAENPSHALGVRQELE
ncbi:unnamed protein product [Calicophoron daubneyi]|uniref:Integral membrane protein GPR155 n=1 Tax=Calicophoron daubneyi TaxID=300641 RepID=A0AAV2TYA4_CALDB